MSSNTAMVVPGGCDGMKVQEKASFHSNSTPSLELIIDLIGPADRWQGRRCVPTRPWLFRVAAAARKHKKSILPTAFHFISFHSNSTPSRNSSSIQSALQTVGKTRDRRCVPTRPWLFRVATMTRKHKKKHHTHRISFQLIPL